MTAAYAWRRGETGGSGGAGAAGAAASGVGGLTAAQLANAGDVIEEGRRRGVPVQGIVVALATASQESHFTNYANDGKGGDLYIFQVGIERSLDLPHEAVGTDHGSLGVFQQQWPWWGTMQDLMDAAGGRREVLRRPRPGAAAGRGCR